MEFKQSIQLNLYICSDKNLEKIKNHIRLRTDTFLHDDIIANWYWKWHVSIRFSLRLGP